MPIAIIAECIRTRVLDPNGSCWGDSLPCIYDTGAFYCTKPQDRPTVTMPNLVAGQWYCVEEMLDMGTATSTAQSANGPLLPLAGFELNWRCPKLMDQN